MPVHIIRTVASVTEVAEMLECYGDFIKLAVDVSRAVLAGGGEYHADGEEALLADGSWQADVWGADWYPGAKTVEFGALINIRPAEGNRDMHIRDAGLRSRIEAIVRARFE